MTTLDAPTLLYYRRLTGVNTTELTDTMIQEAYDRSVLLDDDTTIIKALTVVDMLEQLRGQFLKVIDVRGEVESEARNVIWDRITENLEYWEGKAGISGVGTMNSGTLTLHIDYNADDVITEASNTLLE